MTFNPRQPKKLIIVYATNEDIKKVSQTQEIMTKSRQDIDSFVRNLPKDTIILDILEKSEE